jgi:hypothetical protein
MDEAIIRAIEPYDLHGVRWYRIAYSPAATPAAVSEARFSWDVIYPNPQPGDRVRIRTLLGVIDRVERGTGNGPRSGIGGE